MGAGGKGLRQYRRPPQIGEGLGQRLASAQRLCQWLRQHDALPVAVEGQQNRQVGLHAADARLHTVHQSAQRMGGIQFARQQLVADRRPRGLAMQLQLQAVLAIELQAHRGHQRRAIDQRHEAQAQKPWAGDGVGVIEGHANVIPVGRPWR
jgi:hypothetical protein